MGGKPPATLCPEPGCGKKLVRCRVLQPRDPAYGRMYDICTKCYLRFWLDDESYNVLREVDSPAAHTLPTPAFRSRRPSISRAQSTPPQQPAPGSGYSRSPSESRPPLFSLARVYSGPARERGASSGAGAYQAQTTPAVNSPHGTRPNTPSGSERGGSSYFMSQPPTPTSSQFSQPSRPPTPSGRSNYGRDLSKSRGSSLDREDMERSAIYSEDGEDMRSPPLSPMQSPAGKYQSPPGSFRTSSVAPQSPGYQSAPGSLYNPSSQPQSPSYHRTPSAPPVQPGVRSRTSSQGSISKLFSGMRASSPAPRTVTLSPPRQSLSRTWVPGVSRGGTSGGATQTAARAPARALDRRMSVGANSYRWGEGGKIIKEAPAWSERYQPLDEVFADEAPPPAASAPSRGGRHASTVHGYGSRGGHNQYIPQEPEGQFVDEPEQYVDEGYPPEDAGAYPPEEMCPPGESLGEMMPMHEERAPMPEEVPAPLEEPAVPEPAKGKGGKGPKVKGGKKSKKGAAEEQPAW